MTASLRPTSFLRSSCDRGVSFAPLEIGHTQLKSFGLLENRCFLEIDIRPKMIFCPLSALFILGLPLFTNS
jgi:hypothetical protein